MILVALGICTFFPALSTPRFLDDYLQALMIDGSYPVPRSPLNLYDFIDESDRALFSERGLLPWWAHPELKLRHLRPLSSALMWLEHGVLKLDMVLRHVHSFAWWLACVFAARALFRRLVSERAALLATLAFAYAPCHALPLGWIANRNALLSLAFGVWGLGAYLEWRTRLRWRACVASFALFSAAILAGEYALCFAGYVTAIELTRRGEPLARRALALLPFALPTALYLGVRHALGYGSVGSGFYVDPLDEPWTFLRLAPFRLAAQLGQGWLTINPETWLFDDGLSWLIYPVLLLAALAIGALLRRTYAALPEATRLNGSWLLLGSGLAIVPVLPTFPSARLMGIALIGIAANVGLILEHAWFPREPALRSRSMDYAGLLAIVLGFIHFVHGPVSAWLAASQVQRDASRFASDVTWIGKRLHELDTSEVVVLRGGVDAFFGPFALVSQGGPWSRWDILSEPGHLLTLRPDEQTLELVTPAHSGLFPTGGLNLFRAPKPRIRAGDEIQTKTFALRVVSVGKAGPTRARVAFHRPLEQGRLWVWRQNGRIHELEPLEVGFGLPSDP